MKQLIGILHWAVVMSLSSTKNKVCQFCISSKKEKEVSTPSPTPAFIDQSNAGEVTAWKNCYLKSKMQNLKLLKILEKKICLHWLKKRICCRQILMSSWMDLYANNKITPAFEKKIAFLANFPKYFIVLSKSSFGMYSLNCI